MNRYLKVALGAATVAVFGMAGGSFAAPSAPPTGAILFPAGFSSPIYVGNSMVYDPTATTVGSTSSPPTSTSTSTTMKSTTTSTVKPTTTTSSTAKPTTTTSTTVRPTTTTMSMPMTNMPTIDNSKIPAPFAGKTGPLTMNASYGFQQSDGTGAFRITSRYSHFSYDDPIVFPGQPGASHLHVFFGNTCINASTTDARSCTSSRSDGGSLNESGYWVPAIIDTATHAPITPTDMQVYYKTGYGGVRPSDVKPFPAGLKMVAGNSKATTADPGVHDYDRVMNWECDNGNGGTFAYLPTGCQTGTWLVMAVEFPQCWDGVHLDSADHKSHMAYPTGNGCPSDHPVALPEVTERALYTVPASGTSTWRLSSDNYSGGPGGYSGHADWMNGWDPATMQKVITNCENAAKDCSMDLLGDGTMLYYGANGIWGV